LIYELFLDFSPLLLQVCRIAIETHPKNAEVIRLARNAIGAFSPVPPVTSQQHALSGMAAPGNMTHSASTGML
jgi:hypothetical protein